MENYSALTIFGSAKCTLECKYCYIKKTEGIKRIDDQVIKWLENPVIPEIIDKENITSMTLWGGEPTLHLDIISKNIKTYKKLFPNLNKFHTSSNMTFSKHYDIFCKMLKDNDYEIDLQISDDSDLFNKENRNVSSELIQKNTLKFIELLDKYKCKFTYHFKSTTSIDNFELLYNSDEALIDYFTYFETFAGKIKEIVGKDKFYMMQTAATIVCPGAYTKSNGITLSNYLNKLFNWLHTEKFSNFKNTIVNLNYPERWAINIDNITNFSNHSRSFTCSAGDSNIQIDTLGGIHPCHRTLFFVYEHHLENLRSLDSFPNDDVEYLKDGLIDVFNKYYKLDHKFLKLHMRSFHDNYKHRLATTTATIMEAAHCNQILPIYKNRKLAELYSLYLGSCTGCPVENFFVTSSWHLIPLSIIRMFGNGAFELINNIAYKGTWNGRLSIGK